VTIGVNKSQVTESDRRVDEKTLAMIVGQEGGAPNWWDRARASNCSRCREGPEGGRRERASGRRGELGEASGGCCERAVGQVGSG